MTLPNYYWPDAAECEIATAREYPRSSVDACRSLDVHVVTTPAATLRLADVFHASFADALARWRGASRANPRIWLQAASAPGDDGGTPGRERWSSIGALSRSLGLHVLTGLEDRREGERLAAELRRLLLPGAHGIVDLDRPIEAGEQASARTLRARALAAIESEAVRLHPPAFRSAVKESIRRDSGWRIDASDTALRVLACGGEDGGGRTVVLLAEDGLPFVRSLIYAQTILARERKGCDVLRLPHVRLGDATGGTRELLARLGARYGADGLRVGLLGQCGWRRERSVPYDRIRSSLDLLHKVYQVGRYVASKGWLPAPHASGALDVWMIRHVQDLAREVTSRVERYSLGEACHLLRQSFLTSFYSFYFPAAKTGSTPRRAETDSCLRAVYARYLDLLAPILPFLVERMRAALGGREGCVSLPDAAASVDVAPIESMRLLKSLTRHVRLTHGISLTSRRTLLIAPEHSHDAFEGYAPMLDKLLHARVHVVVAERLPRSTRGAASFEGEGFRAVMELDPAASTAPEASAGRG